MIYFVRPVGQRGPVKIGYSTNPEQRLANMQTGSPVRLEIVALVSGIKENELHWRFRDQQFFGEWFNPSDDLDELMREHAVTPIQAPIPRAPKRPAIATRALPVWKRRLLQRESARG